MARIRLQCLLLGGKGGLNSGAFSAPVLFSVLIERGNNAARLLPYLGERGRGRPGIRLFQPGTIVVRFCYIHVFSR
jgi:hypothetical protein